MKTSTLIKLASLIGITLGAMAAQAQVILYNTGVDASGTPLPDGTIGDPHYSLVSVPGGTTDIRVRTSAGGYPVTAGYIGDDALSAWIGPNNDSSLDGPSGLYDYQTTFDINAINPATVSIMGQYATDNEMVDVYLNGHSLGISNPSPYGYAQWTPFQISPSTDFVSGNNTLDFIVNNDSLPTALRVEMTAFVPEPAAPLIFCMGLVFFGFVMARTVSSKPA
jgi:hypothetical protein